MAASSLPIPQAPRTPSPLSDDPPSPTKSEHLRGLGLDGFSAPSINAEHDYDVQHGISESPSKESLYGRLDSGRLLSPTSATFSTAGGLSPNGSLYTPITPRSAHTTDGDFQPLDAPASQPRNPFNFTTQQYIAGSRANSVGKSEAMGKRRGHKYRHSSIHVSHMDTIFQPPTLKTPLSVPASLPMPTGKEAWWSMTSNQTLRLTWCLCHFLIAGYVQFSGAGSLAMTALSRLLLFDAAGATVCVVVDVMGNFEVWQRSSITHPFGLERADVLAGFGMAVFISFMGLDVISHGIEHSLENVGSHEAHSSHGHERVSTGNVDVASLLAIVATLVSAILLRNHRRIGKAIRFSTIAKWGRIFGNPSHVLTLSCSALLLALPLLSIKTYAMFDFVLSVGVATLMIVFGVRLGTSLASMLLMSYKSANGQPTIRHIISEIETDPNISAIEEVRCWQVHYSLCMANLKLRYRPTAGFGDDMMRIRERITSLVRQQLGGKWEITIQMAVERD